MTDVVDTSPVVVSVVAAKYRLCEAFRHVDTLGRDDKGEIVFPLDAHFSYCSFRQAQERTTAP